MSEWLVLIISLLTFAIAPYLHNQLPEARKFRGSGLLVSLLLIELGLLGSLTNEISKKTDFYKAHQALFDKGVLVVGGAFVITALFYFWRLLRQSPVQNAAASTNLRDRLLRAELAEVAKRQEDSLHGKSLIPLEMTDERKQVGRSSKRSATSGSTSDLPPATRMVEVFRREEVNGRLLILGNPGVGKTAMLLELAKALLEKGKQDAKATVPIILELSTWREEKGKTLKDWLVEQLCQKYPYLGQEVALEWLESGQILPLLDGLDELGNQDRQKKAIAAINAYLEGSFAELVVCCRWEEDQATHSQLVEHVKHSDPHQSRETSPEEDQATHSQLVELGTAVRIQSPTVPQIEAYLNSLNKAELWQHIKTDTDLLKLAKIPLFLYMMVYIDQPGQSFHSKEELFKAYTERRFEVQQSEVERPKRKTVYPRGKEPKQKKTRRYLVWLAKQMKQHNQTEFWIEKMQPDWLEPPDWAWYYMLPLFVLFVVLPILMGIALGIFVIFTVLTETTQFDFLKILQLAWFALGWIFALILMSRDSFNSLYRISVIETVQIYTTKYSAKILVLRGLVFGLVTAFTVCGIERWWIQDSLWKLTIAATIIALIAGSILADNPSWPEIRERMRQHPEGRRDYLKRFRWNLLLTQYLCWMGGFFLSFLGIIIGGWQGGLISGVLGLFGVTVFGISIKLQTTSNGRSANQDLDENGTILMKFNLTSKLPNQGIRVYTKVAIIFITLNLMLHLAVWQIPSLRAPVFGNLPASLSFLVISLFIFFQLCRGLMITQHFALRLILWHRNSIPWDYEKFLKYTAELRLIQQVGGRYRFIHPLLRDHFAAMR